MRTQRHISQIDQEARTIESGEVSSEMKVKYNNDLCVTEISICDSEMSLVLRNADLTLNDLIVALMQVRAKADAGQVRVYDGTRCPIQGVSLFDADGDVPYRVVLR